MPIVRATWETRTMMSVGARVEGIGVGMVARVNVLEGGPRWE